jgi:hypothetical protein
MRYVLLKLVSPIDIIKAPFSQISAKGEVQPLETG